MFEGASKKRAYVIPAFSSSLPPYDIPKTKKELINAIKDRTVEQVNILFQHCLVRFFDVRTFSALTKVSWSNKLYNVVYCGRAV